MEERENVLRILEETKKAIKRQDSNLIKKLSNQTINTASLTHDPDNIAVAIVVYSLSKIIERETYKKYPGWDKLHKSFEQYLDNAISAIKEEDEEKFGKSIGSLREAIKKLSGKLKKYVQDVFRKASINKASRIYEHGISMEKTAKLLGITMFELANYAGQTGISDVPESKTLGVKQRIKLAMEMFE